jgi:muramoyltetrapeptide carboxypeptidase
MIRPDYLKKGDLVGLVAPSRWVTEAEIAPFLKTLSGWGFKYRLADNLFTRQNQFAGDAKQRTASLLAMLADPEVKAVFSVRGGYGAIHLLDELTGINPDIPPKWLVGFSDITVLHFYFQSKMNCQSLHAAMPYQSGTGDGTDPDSMESMRKALFGKPLQHICAGHQLNRQGKAAGTLMGGNLSVIYSLAGTGYFPDADHLILFLEDVDEYLYHIDRMMYALRLTGLLDRINALVIGSMNRMHDNEIPFGKDAYRIIHDIIKEYTFPVCFGFPAGHQEPNLALIMGGEVELIVDSNNCELKFK